MLKDLLGKTDDKVVIVSEWTSFLEIIAKLLESLLPDIKFVTFYGSVNITKRSDIALKFNEPTNPARVRLISTTLKIILISSIGNNIPISFFFYQVMLLSLKAGGVGLNLIGANHLFLMEPHWNPQLESQAIDRVYRIGQQKDVKIYK